MRATLPETRQTEKSAAAAETNESFRRWLARTAFHSRRRIATLGAMVLAVLIGYHVVNGHNGITIYQQKRAEDKALKIEIDRLQQENLGLKDHVERLRTEPGAIIHEARERLHYTMPGEVIYSMNRNANDSPGDDNAGGANPGNANPANANPGDANLGDANLRDGSAGRVGSGSADAGSGNSGHEPGHDNAIAHPPAPGQK